MIKSAMQLLTEDSLRTERKGLEHVGARAYSGIEKYRESTRALGLLDPLGFAYLL